MKHLTCLMDCIISEIQDYIEYIIKNHETIGENAPILT